MCVCVAKTLARQWLTWVSSTVNSCLPSSLLIYGWMENARKPPTSSPVQSIARQLIEFFISAFFFLISCKSNLHWNIRGVSLSLSLSFQWLINQLLWGNQGVDHTEREEEEETEKRRWVTMRGWLCKVLTTKKASIRCSSVDEISCYSSDFDPKFNDMLRKHYM